MVGSLRSLLAGAIDYAGLFPPASLPLDRAIEEFATHGQTAEAWMLARFVCPDEHVARLRGERSAAGWKMASGDSGRRRRTLRALSSQRLRERSSVASASLIHEHDVLEVRLPSLDGDEFPGVVLWQDGP